MTGELIPLDLMPSSQGPGRHHAPLPDRPDRGHQPVQLPAQPRRPQARAGDRAGNPIVLKPPSKDPLTMLTVAEIIEAAGPPAGSVQHPADDPRAGRPDGRRRAVQAADVHRQPARRLADEGARRQEEGRARARRQRRRHRRCDRGPRLGGQALPDRRVRLCRPGLHQRPADVRPRGRSGTRSWRGSSPASAALKVGDPLDPTTDVGPMVDAQPGRRGPSAGWTRRSRSAARSWPAARADGTFFPPTVLTDVPVTAQVCSNEAFAPLVVAFPFQDLDEAIARVNDTMFGLQTGVFTNDLGGRLAGVQRARGRRRHHQRHPDLPDRPHAVRRREGLRPGSRGPALGDRGHDRDPDHGAGPAGLTGRACGPDPAGRASDVGERPSSSLTTFIVVATPGDRRPLHAGSRAVAGCPCERLSPRPAAPSASDSAAWSPAITGLAALLHTSALRVRGPEVSAVLVYLLLHGRGAHSATRVRSGRGGVGARSPAHEGRSTSGDASIQASSIRSCTIFFFAFLPQFVRATETPGARSAWLRAEPAGLRSMLCEVPVATAVPSASAVRYEDLSRRHRIREPASIRLAPRWAATDWSADAPRSRGVTVRRLLRGTQSSRSSVPLTVRASGSAMERPAARDGGRDAPAPGVRHACAMDLTLSDGQLELQARARAFIRDVLQPLEGSSSAQAGGCRARRGDADPRGGRSPPSSSAGRCRARSAGRAGRCSSRCSSTSSSASRPAVCGRSSRAPTTRSSTARRSSGRATSTRACAASGTGATPSRSPAPGPMPAPSPRRRSATPPPASTSSTGRNGSSPVRPTTPTS